jgi:hypothetical protein
MWRTVLSLPRLGGQAAIIEAHGGLPTWDRFDTDEASIVSGGFFPLKGFPCCKSITEVAFSLANRNVGRCDSGSDVLCASVVYDLKSGIYDLWAAARAP